MKRHWRVGVAMGLGLALAVTAHAQTPAQVEELMRVNGWTQEEAQAWGQRYYGWGVAPVHEGVNTGAGVNIPPPCETVGAVTVCDLSECVGLDIYKEGAKALACVQWMQARRPPEPPPVYVFRVGATYRGAYPSFRMRVLGLTVDGQGREVVTCEWLAGSATGVFAMLNAPGTTSSPHPGFWILEARQ